MSDATHCQMCGREAPVRPVLFLQNVGLLVVRFSKTAQGNLCYPCIHKTFWEFTGITLVAGWWGMISFCLTPFFILNNVGRYGFYIATSGPHRRRAREGREARLAQERDLMALYKDGDLASGRKLAASLLEMRQFREARSFLDGLTQAHPDDAEGHFLLGLAKAAETTASAAATAHYERAFELAPDQFGENLAYHMGRTGDHERAVALFRELLTKKPEHPPYLFQAAHELATLGRFDEARSMLDSLEGVVPDARRNQDVAALSARVNMRRRPPTPVDPSAMRRRNRRQGLLVLGLCAAVALLGFVGLLFADHWVSVHVFNPSGAPLRVRFDGGEWLDLSPGAHEKTGLARGAHVLESIAGTSGKVERTTVTVEARHMLALMNGTLYVCDPLGLGVYCDYDMTYGTARSFREPVYHAAEPWFGVAAMDYAFVDPPAQIQVSNHEQGTLKRALKVVTDVSPRQIVGFLLSQKRNADAARFIKASIERSPDDAGLVSLLLYTSTTPEEHEAALKWIDERRTDDPSSIHFHRSYQDFARGLGNAHGLEEEYRKRLATKPESAFLSYLYSRVCPTEEAALAAAEKALDLDPSFAWAHLSAGHSCTLLDRYDDALPHLTKFLELRGPRARDERATVWSLLFEARNWEELARQTQGMTSPAGDLAVSASMTEGHALIATDAPDQRWSDWISRERSRHTDTSIWTMLELHRARWRGNRTMAEHALSQLEGNHVIAPEHASITRAMLRVASGDLEGAASELEKRLQDKEADEGAVHAFALLGTAFEWTGDRTRSAVWYGRAQERATIFDDHELCRYLLGQASEHDLVNGDPHRSQQGRALSAVARAMRAEDAEARSKLLDRAVRVASFEMADVVFVVRDLLSRTPPAR